MTWHLPLHHRFLLEEVSLSLFATGTEGVASTTWMDAPKKVTEVTLTCTKTRKGHQRFWGQDSNFILVQKRLTEMKITKARRWIEDQRRTYCLFPQGPNTATIKSMSKLPLHLEKNLNIFGKKIYFVQNVICVERMFGQENSNYYYWHYHRNKAPVVLS